MPRRCKHANSYCLAQTSAFQATLGVHVTTLSPSFLPLTSAAAASRTGSIPSSLGSAQGSGRRVLAQAALPALPLRSGSRALCQVGQRPIQTPKESAPGSMGCFSWCCFKPHQGGPGSPSNTVFLTVSWISPLLLFHPLLPPSFLSRLPSNPPSLAFPYPEKNPIPSTAGNSGLPAPTWWVRSNAVFSWCLEISKSAPWLQDSQSHTLRFLWQLQAPSPGLLETWPTFQALPTHQPSKCVSIFHT